MTLGNFTTEMKYIRNVSPKTLELYSWSFKAFDGAMDSKAAALVRIAELREKGCKAVTVNTYLRCLNSYFNWLHTDLRSLGIADLQKVHGGLLLLSR